MTAELCYLYAVGRPAELDEAAEGVTGQDGAAVRTVYAAGLGALVSTVSADRFGEEGLKAQLEDLDRLEAVARCHHGVVAAAYQRTTVLPMRLASVYLDDAGVTAMLRERGEEFLAMLSQLEGHVEWGVKIYADPGRAVPAPARPVPPSAESPGRAYLQRRQENRRNQQQLHRDVEAVVSRVAEAAGELAAARVAHRPQQGELATGPGENVTNDGYLVPSGHGEAFREAVTRPAGGVPGVRVEVTGPWAPYSFAVPRER
ncbi:GvpL/GvpF family gas vesicle protein [Streptomyces sp. N2-109]|uniref:GvpL/GvpF family gas vesicle protein n=1 Tax=Streptomyces gossypii TaxID=2883101 RepID=A0ABT2JL91_9ACTN|nr:GvpL/GvpF family gas vesicle protein [Streptomyces gossypii]MCT2588635.1 GvpL/GvpF family gas vesicle protein [Streptomyces gossypii]